MRETAQGSGTPSGTLESRSTRPTSEAQAIPEAFVLTPQTKPADTEKLATKPIGKEQPCVPDEQLVVVFQDGMNSKGDPLASTRFKEAVEAGLDAQNLGHEKKNLKILDSPYPRFNDGCEPIDYEQPGLKGFWNRLKTRTKNAFRYAKNACKNVKLYLDYQNPYSKASDKAYAAFKDSLDLKPGDRKNVLINGHSGAGALASVYSRRLQDEAEALKAQGIDVKVTKVITHGSPYIHNHTPPEVELCNCDSPGDGIQSIAGLVPGVRRVAPNHDGNDRVVRFGNRIGHREYYRNKDVLDFVQQVIVSEYQKRQPKSQPAKRGPAGNLPLPEKSPATIGTPQIANLPVMPDFIRAFQQTAIA